MNGKTKYPILLVHGMGFRDYKRLCYWGRIPKMLESLGNKVYFGMQDSNGDIETNGAFLAERIKQVLEESGAEKLNIIAHSKGGLDSRYAISTLGMGDRIASLTTISTPHNGSKTVDKFLFIPKFLAKAVCFCYDCFYRVVGDKKPNTYNTVMSFTTEAASRFNRENPNCENVYYQSYAFVMKKPTSDIFMRFTNAVVSHFEGENDGMLAPDAVKWGEFKGIFRGVGNRGVSHCDEIDFRRRRLTKKQGEGVCEILDVYKEIACDLEARGF